MTSFEYYLFIHALGGVSWSKPSAAEGDSAPSSSGLAWLHSPRGHDKSRGVSEITGSSKSLGSVLAPCHFCPLAFGQHNLGDQTQSQVVGKYRKYLHLGVKNQGYQFNRPRAEVK